ncbi:MAG: cation transporter [Chitinophagaceae bacterium]
MKTFKLFLASLLMVSFSFAANAQEKAEAFKVSGNCGMCKNKIEKAAKSAGATSAVWDTETKQLKVKYSSTSSNTAKIQQSIAAAGYDTPSVKATQEAYDNLHGCCKYERETSSSSEAKEAKACCADGICAKTGEPCKKDMSCCKSGDHKCSTDGKCNHAAAGAGKDCCKKV